MKRLILRQFSCEDPVLVADLLQVQMCIWKRAKGIQCPVKGSTELQAARRRRLGSALHVPLNNKDVQETKTGTQGVSGSVRQAWLD